MYGGVFGYLYGFYEKPLRTRDLMSLTQTFNTIQYAFSPVLLLMQRHAIQFKYTVNTEIKQILLMSILSLFYVYFITVLCLFYVIARYDRIALIIKGKCIENPAR